MATRRAWMVLGAAALTAGAARAQDGPVTLLVPYTPGTGPDLLARLLSPPLQQALGQAMVVENRAGASGNIGTQAVARAAPDGRTLVLQANTFVMNPSLFRQVPYDPVGSFTPIVRISRGDLVLAVNPEVAADDAQGFAALARRQVLDYASPGIGTPQHLGMALFGLEAQARLNHVPYRGSAPAIQDLIGRRVAAMVLPLHTALPLAEAKQVRLLAIGSPARAAAAPGVPTMAEAGFPGVEVDLWYGLLGPAGLPAPWVARLNAAVNAWVALATTQDQLRAQGMQPVGGSPAEFAATIAVDLARWAEVIRAAGIHAD
ncbi:tripartite tricarboxylate transporter substrate binding protein [Dankookia rubra]|uniref:Tripartite tricarboxylate transporter substrate binding protein n=1 Tax=Dankookia rubra TaxID=1442381 RepID=A0A4R5QMC8_9PROT|nr:tripartite tricarboxylate transporter substrate binding protein [Dankookia rubra]TDH63917.1 tripartite tricarboxylate transporter substrate binding protein [Dankookia rubra]